MLVVASWWTLPRCLCLCDLCGSNSSASIRVHLRFQIGKVEIVTRAVALTLFLTAAVACAAEPKRSAWTVRDHIPLKDFTVQAHWALYVENYLEGFHIPFVHAALNEAVDYGTYATELDRYANLQLARATVSTASADMRRSRGTMTSRACIAPK